jgi:hypothetical protein
LVKNVRKEIRNWFDATVREAGDPGKQVLKDVEGGYQIDCLVSGLTERMLRLGQ